MREEDEDAKFALTTLSAEEETLHPGRSVQPGRNSPLMLLLEGFFSRVPQAADDAQLGVLTPSLYRPAATSAATPCRQTLATIQPKESQGLDV